MDKKNSHTHSKPHYYGKIDQVHVFHATADDHKALVGEHIESPDDDALKSAISKAKENKSATVVIHGAPPKSLRSKINEDLGIAHKVGSVNKSESISPVAFESLSKTFLQPDQKTKSDINAHVNSLNSLHPALKAWAQEKLVSLPKDATESIDLAGHKIKVHKYDADLYSGWIVDDEGNKVHQFERLGMPELMAQIQSKLELYGKEEEVTEIDPADIMAKIKGLHDRIREYLGEPELDLDKDPDFMQYSEAAAKIKEVEDSSPKVEDRVEIPAKELLNQSDEEQHCQACEMPDDSCVCFTGLPKPHIEVDYKTKKITILFKSEWDQESRSSFIEDLKERGLKILRARK